MREGNPTEGGSQVVSVLDEVALSPLDMRRDTLILIKDAMQKNRRAYVLVNNRLEGNAPLTVQALTDLLRTA